MLRAVKTRISFFLILIGRHEKSLCEGGKEVFTAKEKEIK